jgi:hypothetical protein
MDNRVDEATAARLFVLLVGSALVIGGIAGFFYEADFSTGGGLVSDDILGVFPTNGWDNVFHVIAGLACLAAAARAPRQMALAIGALFTVVAVWGLLVTDGGVGSIAGTIPVSTEDNLLHLAVGLTAIAAGLARGGGRPAAPA